MERVLVVEDLSFDAGALLLRDPIRERFLQGTRASIPTESQFRVPEAPEGARVQTADFEFLLQLPIATTDSHLSPEQLGKLLPNGGALIVKNTELAFKQLKAAKFDLVISDLFFFQHTDELWMKYGEKYAEYVDFETEMLPQIRNPEGILLAERIQTELTGLTDPAVPIILMTFFWNHPRFETYRERMETSKRLVAYLPKYYKLTDSLRPTDDALGTKGDKILRLLLELLLPKAKTPATDLRTTQQQFAPFVFEYIANLLYVENLEPRLVESFHRMKASFDVLCRAFVNASIVFDLSKVCEEPPADEKDELQYIAKKLSDPRAVATVDLKFHAGAPRRKTEPLVSLPGDSITETPTERRRLLVLLALALYTLPFPDGKGQGMREPKLKEILVKAGIVAETIPKRFASQDVTNLRKKIQPKMPKHDFMRPTHYLIEGSHEGYFLNTGYEIVYKEGKSRQARPR